MVKEKEERLEAHRKGLDSATESERTHDAKLEKAQKRLKEARLQLEQCEKDAGRARQRKEKKKLKVLEALSELTEANLKLNSDRGNWIEILKAQLAGNGGAETGVANSNPTPTTANDNRLPGIPMCMIPTGDLNGPYVEIWCPWKGRRGHSHGKKKKYFQGFNGLRTHMHQRHKHHDVPRDIGEFMVDNPGCWRNVSQEDLDIWKSGRCGNADVTYRWCLQNGPAQSTQAVNETNEGHIEPEDPNADDGDASQTSGDAEGTEDASEDGDEEVSESAQEDAIEQQAEQQSGEDQDDTKESLSDSPATGDAATIEKNGPVPEIQQPQDAQVQHDAEPKKAGATSTPSAAAATSPSTNSSKRSRTSTGPGYPSKNTKKHKPLLPPFRELTRKKAA